MYCVLGHQLQNPAWNLIQTVTRNEKLKRSRLDFGAQLFSFWLAMFVIPENKGTFIAKHLYFLLSHHTVWNVSFSTLFSKCRFSPSTAWTNIFCLFYWWWLNLQTVSLRPTCAGTNIDCCSNKTPRPHFRHMTKINPLWSWFVGASTWAPVHKKIHNVGNELSRPLLIFTFFCPSDDHYKKGF